MGATAFILLLLSACVLSEGCANKPRITSIAIVGTSGWEETNFWGNFYEDKDERVNYYRPQGIGIKIKGDF